MTHNKHNTCHVSASLRLTAARTTITLLLLIAASLHAVAQDIIRVTGEVTSKDGETLPGVSIADAASNRTITTTDLDGKFAINVRSNATLRFTMIGAKKQEVRVKGRKHITVKMEEDDIALQEITVSAKRVTDKIIPEPTDIEIHGNYFHVKTRVRVPKEMFGTDTRLIVQPVITNVTRKEQTLMRPLVYDAREYNLTQDRMYDYDMESPSHGDPLAQYVVVKTRDMREKGRTNDIISYKDSVYVRHIKDEYTCDVFMVIENYNRILYRDTTVIARGTVNPLRWLDYSLAASELNDETYLPKPETQLRDSKGEINLVFPVGKYKFDPSLPANAAEIDKMKAQIDYIARQDGASLQSLEMTGQASPEGNYERNLTLARQRMDFAVNYLKQLMPQEMRQNVEFKYNAQVAKWSDVALLMRMDGLNDEADRLTAAYSKYKSQKNQDNAVFHLPFYNTLVKDKYLPRLRRAEYALRYSLYRELTDAEILDMYNNDYRQLSRYEFFRLFRNEKDPSKKELILRQALEIYPKYMVAANDLAAMLINRNEPSDSVLAIYAGERAPEVINRNHMIALLAAGKYHDADTLAQYIDESQDNRLLLAVNSVLNGRYDDNFATIAETGIRNEVVMLLAMKRNEEALNKSRRLPADNALSHYLRAICLNRAERPSDACDELFKAFEMDPSLKIDARVDGDVNDLFDIDPRLK